MLRMTAITLVLLVNTIGFGCSHGDQKSAQHPAKHGGPDHDPQIHKPTGKSIKSQNAKFSFSYESEPNEIPVNGLFTLKIKAFMHTTDGEDQPLPEGVSLVVDAAMPHHHHGMNVQPQVRRLEDGSFFVEGLLFHMPGYWEIYVDVLEGDHKERAIFALIVE